MRAGEDYPNLPNVEAGDLGRKLGPSLAIWGGLSHVSARWKLVPHYLLRRAGFPFALLEPLRSPRSAALAQRLAETVAEAEAARATLLKGAFKAEVPAFAERKDKPALRRLSRWRRQVGLRQAAPVPEGPWSEALLGPGRAYAQARVQEAKARTELEALVAEELAAARRTLRQTFKDPQTREALFLLSPGFLDVTEKKLDEPPSPTPDSHERALERRLYAFLQRLSAKNETTSFFGPLAYGVVGEAKTPFVFGPEAPQGVVRREAFAAFWAVTALGKAAVADPALREALPPRRVAVSWAKGTQGVGPDGAPVVLSDAAAKVFSLVDGERSLAALAHAGGLSLEETKASVTLLERKGFVRRDLEPLSTVGDVLGDLIRRLPSVPAAEKWRDALGALQGHLKAFASSQLPERRTHQLAAEARFTQLTGIEARRAGGKMYADRTVLYEDCLGDLQPLVMATTEAERLEQALGPLLDLGATYGALRVAAVHQLAAAVLQELGGKARFLHFAEVLDAKVAKGGLEPSLGPAKAWLAKLTAAVQAKANGGGVAHFDAAELEPLIERQGAGRFASPDVMLERLPGGQVRFVIGEVHPYVYAWGSQNQFAPDQATLQAAFVKDLTPWGGRERMATVLRRRRHKGLVSEVFPGAFIEISGRGRDDARRTLAVADLEVVLEGGAPKLMGPHGALTLYAGEDDHPHLRVFAPPPCEMPPIRIGKRTPRVEVGDAVLQRARWYVEPDEVKPVLAASGPSALMEACTALQRRLGLPRHVFAGSPSEPKPMCIDFESTHAQELLARMLEAGPVSLVEMLPGPGGLWLERKAGHVTTELRTAMIREP